MLENIYFTIIDKENVGLAGVFSVNPSSCENSEFYRAYLQFSAINDLYSGRNTTYLLIDKDANKIMGFVSLRASAIISHGECGNMTGVPAIEVSVLAVDKNYTGQGVGSMLIDYVIYQANELHKQHIGLQAIILAADKKSVGFYNRMGFIPIEDRWKNIPKESWNTQCVPMLLYLEFEKNYIVSYTDSEEDNE